MPHFANAYAINLVASGGITLSSRWVFLSSSSSSNIGIAGWRPEFDKNLLPIVIYPHKKRTAVAANRPSRSVIRCRLT